MNARKDQTMLLSLRAADPLASLRAPNAAIADLAFGSLTADASVFGDGHLAILPAEALELDLTDPAQRRFGDYELLELIGRGGMGVVYRAHQASLDREVAIKLLAAGPWASREFIERFRFEAQNAARMQHPNIVAIYEVGAAEEMHFFSMRLVHGGSLASLLKREGRLDPRRAAQLLRTVAEAVDYAHRLGVLHLDLKPANVLLDETGAPHVADFGLARRLGNDLATTNTEVSGTPSYMAPEQATAGPQKITPATDIWGLGAILYELVTGEPPFLGESPQDTLKLVVDGTVRGPRRFVPTLPRDLEAIILKCMRHDVAQRYPNGRALADDLVRFLDAHPVSARPLNAAQRTWRWARREPKFATAAVLAFAALTAGIVATTQQARRADANAATASRELWDSREADALRLSEAGDGWKAAPLLLANIREMQLAGAAERLAGARKRMGILFNANPRLIDAIPGPAEVLGLALSPDGRHLAAGTSDQDVRVYDVAKGSETFRVAGRDNVVRGGISNVQHLQFTADSSAIVVTGVTGNVAVPEPPAASMQRIDVGKRDWIAPPAQFANFLDASYSFDGRYAVLTNQSEQAQFWATDPWRPLSPLRTPPAQVGASSRLVAPDGNLFAQDTQAHAVVLINARSLTVRARVNLGDFGTIAAWAFSPDSRWLALGDLAGAVAVVDCRTLAVQRPAPQPYFPIFSLAFSADGGWLAAAATAGGVFLWSWPDAQLVAPPFSGSGSLAGIPDALHAVPDRARGLVLSSSETDSTVLWQLAPAASTLDRADAVPLTARLNATHAVQSEQIAWDAARGLLALRSDQRIMLQRLPPPALKHGRAARLIPDTLRFDGRHLVEVDGRSIRIVDTAFEQPAGARVELARPADFAELSADGATLAVICGRMLYAFDAVSGVARFAPTALGGSPSHAVLSPDGKRILIAWSHHGGEGPIVRSDMAVVHDLATGARLGGPAALTGQAHEITFSDDGRRVIAWTRLMLTLRDGSTLAQVPGPLGLFLPNGTKNDLSKERLKVARFDAAGNVVMAYARPGSGEGSASWSLRTWTADGSVREQPLSSVLPLAILPLPDHRTVVAGTEGGMSIVAADGSGQDLPDLPDDSMRMHFAASADGHWLGRARRDGVALFDLRGGTLMATLRVALPRPDTVWQLAFAPDGNKLLGRSLHGRLMVWDLTPDARAPDAIARDLELRDFKPLRSGSRIFSADPSAAERAALRASDPGAPPAPAVPAALETVRMLPGGGIPPRDASAPDTTLDLTPWYTFGLREVLPTVENGGADFHWLPQGVQRLLDVDYDIRGGIGLHSPLRARFDLRRDIGAVDVLLLSEANINATGKDHVADLRLDYADGTQATLPAGLLHDSYYIFGEAGAPASARFAGWGTDARVGTDRHIMLFVARVENPHPEKTVDALTLSAPGNASVQSAIMAVSVEAAPAGKPSASRE